MAKYNPKKIEAKWQKYWQTKGTFKTPIKPDSKKKQYILDMFPYPSGAGLHVGHPEGYTATDIVSRYARMNGKHVLHPMGWDAFGLPAENYAIKQGVHPRITTQKNIKRFRQQIQAIGLSYDWSREVDTSSPEYYKWTQWLFLLLYKHGLAYKKEARVNWCPHDNTVLANEQVINGKCERCGNEVIQKLLSQWFFKITDYAEALLNDIEALDWPEPIKAMQRNWIGKSEGAQIKFQVASTKHQIEVFTTRPDTIFGATYLVLAPEHELVQQLGEVITNHKEVAAYVKDAQKKSELQRTSLEKNKTGVELKGVKAINPATGKPIPVWIADYVLSTYGTGAIMAVPAHDERDFEFATKFKLPIKEVLEPLYFQNTEPGRIVAGLPFKERDAIIAIVKHWSEDKYMGLKWKDVAWGTWITGGIEPGQTAEQAAKMEIREETGYRNPKLVKDFGMVHGKFYHVPKKVNAFVHARILYFELQNGHQDQIEQQEQDKHELLWLTKKELATFLTAETHQYALRSFLGSYGIYTGPGVLTNSGQYDGLESAEAQKIIAKKFGKIKTQYKLRDWLVSRQRYWGAPIPIIYCTHCAIKNIKSKLEISFYDQVGWKAIVGGWKTIETRALNPEEPKRYFGNIKAGDIITIVNKKTSEKRLYEVTDTYIFKTIEELYNQKNILEQVSSTQPPKPLKQFIAEYEYTPGYIEKIKKHGLVGWKLKPVEAMVPVSEKDLPVQLPTDVDFRPTGESPLVRSKKFNKVTCPTCKGPARRDADTMDTFVDSSWYFFRYADPNNNKEFASKKSMQQWLPVDLYVGGAEHAVLHLLYARFFTKVLHDLKYISFNEPFVRLRNQGLILGPDGEKMSKSKGNVINPDDVIAEFGADCLRMYEMFMGPLEDAKPWNTQGIVGVRRFLDRVWVWGNDIASAQAPKADSEKAQRALHKLIKKVTEDIEGFHFNTAISSFMQFSNEVRDEAMTPSSFKTVLKLLYPFAPHIAEELHQTLGGKKSLQLETWPSYDPQKIVDTTVEVIVQINGKVRDRVVVPIGASEDAVRKEVLASEKTKTALGGNQPKRIIVVKNKLVNIVI